MKITLFPHEKGIAVILDTAVQAHYFHTIMAQHSEYQTPVDGFTSKLLEGMDYGYWNLEYFVPQSGNLHAEISIHAPSEKDFLVLRDGLEEWITNPVLYRKAIDSFGFDKCHDDESFLHLLAAGKL